MRVRAIVLRELSSGELVAERAGPRRPQWGAWRSAPPYEYCTPAVRRWWIVILAAQCIKAAHAAGCFPDPRTAQLIVSHDPDPCPCEDEWNVGVKFYADKGAPLPDDLLRVCEALLAQDHS